MRFYNNDLVPRGYGYGGGFDFEALEILIALLPYPTQPGSISWTIPSGLVIAFSLEGYYRLLRGRPIDPALPGTPQQVQTFPVGSLTLTVRVYEVDPENSTLRMDLS